MIVGGFGDDHPEIVGRRVELLGPDRIVRAKRVGFPQDVEQHLRQDVITGTGIDRHT